MNEITINPVFTVREVADLLEVTPEALKKHIREMYPEKMINGMTTYLNEEEITGIKARMLPTTKVVGLKTDLDMIEQTYNVMEWMKGKMELLKKENQEKQERIERLIHNQKTYTTGEIAKELHLKSAQELNNILVEKGIQYKSNDTWLLYAVYSDADYVSIKQQELENGVIVYNRHWTGKGRDFILRYIRELIETDMNKSGGKI